MATITDIKEKIDSLSPGEFQEFCDAILYKKGYGISHGYGMKSGTSKTTKGNPDAYFRKENGKYVFVAYTTQKSRLSKKLEEDINKCLDKRETGLDLNELDEIICCHTSSNISSGDDKKLHDMCSEKGLKLTIWGLDEIAYLVYYNHKILIKDYLGLAIDTNQIMSIADYIDQNDANEMTAPLKTKFLFRETEKHEIKEAILETPVVIVSGKAGVGKTRLVLEAVKEIETQQGYKILCVKNNNQGIYEDLVSSIERNEEYLLFVDDANELGEFEQIVKYITKGYLGYKVKVIATVRDYAKSNVILTTKRYCTPKLIDIQRFSDDEIKEFLDINFGIKNEEYIKQIVRISEGNARMAFMAGRLAAKENNLNAIRDASQLYDAYYEQYVDKSIGSDKNLCFTAGILSVLNAIVLNNLKVIEELLLTFNISEAEFIEKIMQLSRLEIVELKSNRVAMISDQCFANYMLYYVFFKRKLIPFADVLKIGYKHFRNGVTRMINIILNLFDSKDTSEFCKSEVLKVWDDFKKSNDKCFEDFVKDFHVFRPEEGLLIAKQKIDAIEQEKFDVFEVDYKKNKYVFKEEVLQYLEGYQLSKYLDDVISLLIIYAGKNESTLSSAYKWLENNYGIRVSDYKHKYYDQNKICDLLVDEISKGNQIAMSIGLQWAKYLLSFNFDSSEYARGGIIHLYHFEIHNVEGVGEYRSKCWIILKLLAEKKEWHTLIIKTLDSYSRDLKGINDRSVVIGDVEHVDDLFLMLKCDRISFSKVVYRIKYCYKKLGIKCKRAWNLYLIGRDWELFKLLENDYVTSGLSFEDYENNRVVKLKRYGKSIKTDDIPLFMKSIDNIMADIMISNDNYSINKGIETIIQEFTLKHLYDSFVLILNDKVHANINPYSILKRLASNYEPEIILDMLNSARFAWKNDWLFAYYECLSKDRVNNDLVNSCMSFFNDDMNSREEFRYRSLKVLDKFLDFKPNIYALVCSCLFNKIENNKSKANAYFYSLFNEYNYSPSELLLLFNSNIDLLQDIYFYMIKEDKMVDYGGDFLVYYLQLDKTWLQRYTKVFLEHIEKRLDYDGYKIASLWKSDNYMEYFDYIFNCFLDEDSHYWEKAYLAKEIVCCIGKDAIIKERQITWLNHMIKEYAFSEKIKIIFMMIFQFDYKYRLDAFRAFLKINKNYETFKKLQLIKGSWFGSDSLIPAYKEDIDFLNALREIVRGSDFIEHKARIQTEIEMIQKMIEAEEVNIISRNLYM